MAKRKVRQRALLTLDRYAVGMLGLVLCLWLVESSVGEDAWLAMLLTYLPHLPLFPFILGALAPAILERKVFAALCSVLALAVLLHLEGFAWRFAAAAERPGPGLRIVTFNIQKGGAGWSLAGMQIEDVRPDIVCLQEASSVQTDPKGAPIREALAGYFWAHERGVAVASRWPIRRTWVPDLRVESHGWAVFAEVEMPGGVLTVASVHLSPVQWDRFLSAELPKLPEHLRDATKARQRQAQALIEEVNRLSSSSRLILAGDFNGPPRGHLYRSFASRLNDAHAVAGSGFGWTIPAQFPMTRLDYVFSRGLTSHRAQVLPEAGSDHRGVLVDAEW